MKSQITAILKRVKGAPDWLKIIVASLCFILAFISVARYADIQIHDYGVGIVDTNRSASIESGYSGILHALIRWDTNHYVNIINNGYDKQNVAFFPLYPMLAGGVATTLNISAQTALLLVSWSFAILSAIVMFYWIRYELRARKVKVSPWVGLMIFAIFPTSFFVVSGYTESLFLFLLVSALYAYRTRHYVLASLFTALLSATRVQGCVVALFFLLDYLFAKKWSDWKKLLPVIAAPIGLLLYMIYLNNNFGDPLAFIAAQQYWGRLSGSVFRNLLSSFTPVYVWFIPVLVFGLWAINRYLGKTWFIFSLVFLLIPLSSGRLDSLNRYVLTLPPLFWPLPFTVKMYLDGKNTYT